MYQLTSNCLSCSKITVLRAYVIGSSNSLGCRHIYVCDQSFPRECLPGRWFQICGRSSLSAPIALAALPNFAATRRNLCDALDGIEQPAKPCIHGGDARNDGADGCAQ